MIYRMELCCSEKSCSCISKEDKTGGAGDTGKQIDVLEVRWVQTVVCQKNRTTLETIGGREKPHLGIFSCRSVNIWVGSGRAPAQLLYNRLAFRRSSRLTGYWGRRMECWPQGPVPLLSSGGGGYRGFVG